MTEERITRVDTPEGNTHVRTEVIRDAEPRRSGGFGVMLLVVLVIALLVGGFGFGFVIAPLGAAVPHGRWKTGALGEVTFPEAVCPHYQARVATTRVGEHNHAPGQGGEAP